MNNVVYNNGKTVAISGRTAYIIWFCALSSYGFTTLMRFELSIWKSPQTCTQFIQNVEMLPITKTVIAWHCGGL